MATRKQIRNQPKCFTLAVQECGPFFNNDYNEKMTTLPVFDKSLMKEEGEGGAVRRTGGTLERIMGLINTTLKMIISYYCTFNNHMVMVGCGP